MEVLNNPVPVFYTGTDFTQKESAKSLMEIGRDAENIHRNEEGAKEPSESGSEKADKTEQEIKELRKRDAEVKKHEQAHKAAAGSYYVSGPHFEYKVGPDGHRYAVGGNVKVDTSEISGDPEATIKKARQIRRSALAPADPSAQDRQVAAEAARLELKASQELAKQRSEEVQANLEQQSTKTADADLTVTDQKISDISLEDFSPAKFSYDVGTLKTDSKDILNYDRNGKIRKLSSRSGKINVKI